MTTFFAVRDVIAEKLKEITEFKKIYTPTNSTTVTELSQVTPSAHINFVRMQKVSDKGFGQSNLVKKQWAVSVACRNAGSQQSNGNALNDEIGLLTEKVINLLSGFETDHSVDPLVFVDVRDGYSASYAYVTIVFESNHFMQGTE